MEKPKHIRFARIVLADEDVDLGEPIEVLRLRTKASVSSDGQIGNQDRHAARILALRGMNLNLNEANNH